jgi:hypothetical protein
VSDLPLRLSAAVSVGLEACNEEEKIAQAATPGPWGWDEMLPFKGEPGSVQVTARMYDLAVLGGFNVRPGPERMPRARADAKHIAHNDPAHVLAGVASRRVLLEALGELIELHSELQCEKHASESSSLVQVLQRPRPLQPSCLLTCLFPVAPEEN